MKGLFGTNAASDPEVYKLPENTQQLMESHKDTPISEDLLSDNENQQNFKSFYEELFDHSYKNVAASLQIVPVADPAIGSLERG